MTNSNLESLICIVRYVELALHVQVVNCYKSDKILLLNKPIDSFQSCLIPDGRIFLGLISIYYERVSNFKTHKHFRQSVTTHIISSDNYFKVNWPLKDDSFFVIINIYFNTMIVWDIIQISHSKSLSLILNYIVNA